MLRRALIVSLVALSLSSCTLKEEQPSAPADVPAPPDVAAPPADAHRTPSGLASKIVRVGISNTRPRIGSRVRAHYTGWTTDGKMFDSSVGRDPLEFSLEPGALIDGWIEGLQLMVVGEKRRFWIPEALAYKGQPGNPQGMLVFDVELLGVM
jgi:peptidylprolyl isomerase